MNWILYYVTVGMNALSGYKTIFFCSKFHKSYMFLLSSHWSLILVSKTEGNVFVTFIHSIHTDIILNSSICKVNQNVYILSSLPQMNSPQTPSYNFALYIRESFFATKHTIYPFHPYSFRITNFEYHMIWCSTLETRPTNTDLPLCQTAEHFSNATKRVLNKKIEEVK